MMNSSGEFFDYLLGEGSPSERAEIQRRVVEQPEAAVEMGALGLMLDRLRDDSIAESQLSPGMSCGLRYAIRRRAQLRGPKNLSLRGQVVRVLQIAASLTLLLYLLQDFAFVREQQPQLEGSAPGPTVVATVVGHEVELSRADRELDSLLAIDHIPVGDESFLRSLRRYRARSLPADFGSWLKADNLLRQQREEHHFRRSAAVRRRMLAAIGSPDLGARVDSLAEIIADRERRGVANRDVVSSALVLRALLAVGSTLNVGLHQDVVRSCSLRLINRLDTLQGPDLARALAALSDLAIVVGAPLDGLVAKHGERFALAVLRLPDAGLGSARPAMLSWQASESSLADAGQLLKLVPAFGVDSGLAFRARLMIAAHLGERIERIERSERELPSLRAAQLYGFGDLVDRDEIDRKMRLWRPRMLLPNYDALYHLAFSKYPARAGWARFQRELRSLAAATTPLETRDAAALLLCLSSNFAAPGSLGMAQLLAAR